MSIAAEKSIFSASKPSQRNNKEDSSTKLDAGVRNNIPPPKTNRHQDDVILGGQMGNFMNPELPTTVVTTTAEKEKNQTKSTLNYVASIRKFDSDLTSPGSDDNGDSESNSKESQQHHPDLHVALPPSMSEEAELRKKFKVPTQPGTPEEPSHRLHVQELREAEMLERRKLLREEMLEREAMEVERRREAEERAVR